jgi:uncharacterized protein YbjQ (UPF0145 family)
VLISTMNDVRLAARSSFKSLVGGELKGMTKMLAQGREHATGPIAGG